jgi:hypothetical protein
VAAAGANLEHDQGQLLLGQVDVRVLKSEASFRSLPVNFPCLHEGRESHLPPLITKWQKGFKNDPFRHVRFLDFSRISGFKGGLSFRGGGRELTTKIPRWSWTRNQIRNPF